jgi:putative peptidoglycan lipid II flippase
MILSGPILTTLLQYGKFLAFDVAMAQRSLIGFAVGIPAFMLVKVLASGFYSRQNIKTPVRIAIIAMVSNIILDAILIFPLAHAGLALATSLTSSLNAGLLYKMLRKNDFYQPSADWKIFFLRVVAANLVMAIFLWLFTANLSTWLDWSWLNRAWHLGLLCGGAVLIYLVCLWISGIRLKDFSKGNY